MKCNRLPGENLQSLAGRLKSGNYRAPPVKRVYIPKAGSAERRPLGILTYADKILQRAVQMALKPIYERNEDADRILKVLAVRFAKYGLTIHPEKTKRVDFRKPAGENRTGNGRFTFLGFVQYWTKSRTGRWMVGRKTDRKRLSRALQAITRWCRENRRRAKREQHQELSAKLRGHYGYYGIPLNYARIGLFYEQVKRIWYQWLNRRSTKVSQDWQQFSEYLRNYLLPTPSIMHSWS
jgi:hypothetical protein